MATGYPVGYIRRSSADSTDPGDVSREAQEQAVRELARRDGFNGETRIITDWDRSADPDEESRRTGYLSMLAAIERGEVSVVYAASLDRLYRSMRTFVRLTDAARAHGTRIVTLREGVLGGDGSPMAQAFAEITAVFSGLELRTTKARAAGALAVRVERGDHLGRTGYGFRFAHDPDGRLSRSATGGVVVEPNPDEPLAPVIDAMREAGTVLGACKLLERRGIPAPEGGVVWGNTTLRRLIERHAPELLPAPGVTGRRTPAHSTLAQLLVCHCGHVLTPEPGRRAYRCTRGNRLGREVHGALWAPEATVLPFVRAAVDALRVPEGQVELARTNAPRREALQSRLDRNRYLFLNDPDYGQAAYEAEKAHITEALTALDDTEAAVDMPRIDWTWPTADVNRLLRLLIERVQLDPDLRPLPDGITWRGSIAEWAVAPRP